MNNLIAHFKDLSLSDWGNIFTIILGVTSVFTAIVTAYILIKQYKVQKTQFRIEQQPIFHIEKNDKGTILKISNNGYTMGETANVSLSTIMCIKISVKRRFRIPISYCLCIPIKYYIWTHYTQKLEGELAVYETVLLHKDLLVQKGQKIKKILADKFGNGNVELFNADLIHISYKDVLFKNKNIFYLEQQKINKRQYNNYKNSAEKFSHEPLDLYHLDMQQIASTVIETKNTCIFKL
ncbi:MAG: hypothetical protein J1D86_01350 [Alistipes sp.]|nr:hypothetical protein [Alistipes sp.]